MLKKKKLIRLDIVFKIGHWVSFLKIKLVTRYTRTYPTNKNDDMRLRNRHTYTLCVTHTWRHVGNWPNLTRRPYRLKASSNGTWSPVVERLSTQWHEGFFDFVVNSIKSGFSINFCFINVWFQSFAFFEFLILWNISLRKNKTHLLVDFRLWDNLWHLFFWFTKQLNFFEKSIFSLYLLFSALICKQKFLPGRILMNNVW